MNNNLNLLINSFIEFIKSNSEEKKLYISNYINNEQKEKYFKQYQKAYLFFTSADSYEYEIMNNEDKTFFLVNILVKNSKFKTTVKLKIDNINNELIISDINWGMRIYLPEYE